MAITKEFDTKNKNVDAIIETMLQAQRDNGIETHMREALFDPVTAKRINKFQRAKLEAKGVDLSGYGESHKCNQCGKCEDKISNIDRGIFVYSEDDLIDDSNAEYICEYCMKIGLDGKYRPEECDCCDECEDCGDYRRGECDGCAYSPFYNGTTYSQVNEDAASSVNEEDVRLFNETESDDYDYMIHYPSGGFSIMKYD